MLTLIVVIVAIAIAIAVVACFILLPAFDAWVSKEEEVVKKVLDVNKDGKINAADAQAAAVQVAKKVKDVEAKVTEEVKEVAKKKMSAPKN